MKINTQLIGSNSITVNKDSMEFDFDASMNLLNESFIETAATSNKKSCPGSSMICNTIQKAIVTTGVTVDNITDSWSLAGRGR